MKPFFEKIIKKKGGYKFAAYEHVLPAEPVSAATAGNAGTAEGDFHQRSPLSERCTVLGTDRHEEMFSLCQGSHGPGNSNGPGQDGANASETLSGNFKSR